MVCDKPGCDSVVESDKPGKLSDLRKLDNGWRVVDDKYDYCPKCKEGVVSVYATKKRAKYQKRKAEGICPICGKTPTRNKIICYKCREKSRTIPKAHKYKFYVRRKKSGLCFTCGKVRESEMVNCRKCRVEISEQRRNK